MPGARGGGLVGVGEGGLLLFEHLGGFLGGGERVEGAGVRGWLDGEEEWKVLGDVVATSFSRVPRTRPKAAMAGSWVRTTCYHGSLHWAGRFPAHGRRKYLLASCH